MIKNIKINKFRKFENTEFTFGKYITAISGQNATGKSTLLGLIGNAMELKKSEGVTINNNMFRADFSQLFKSSPIFDKSGSNLATVNFCDYDNTEIVSDSRQFRITWQNTRFRVIPYYDDPTDNKRHSSKFSYPVIYLSLSRLYPLGESEIKETNILSLTDTEKDWFIDNYKYIVSALPNMEISSINTSKIEISSNKIGICTPTYDYLTNSSGQDNIGQILLTILSFMRLANSYSRYNGGVLLIDEIEATLHPSSQIKLLQLLTTVCRKLKLQVIFTTHSLFLLEDLCSKVLNNNDSINNKIEVIYLTDGNGKLEIMRNTKYPLIKRDLSLKLNNLSNEGIIIFREDAEAQWFLEKLLGPVLKGYPRIMNMNIGCLQLLELRKNGGEYFDNILFIMDGDVRDSEIDKSNKILPKYLLSDNVIKLPSANNLPPEKELYHFLLNLDKNSEFWTKGFQVTKQMIIENGPENNNIYKQETEREKYKKWFNDHLTLFEMKNIFEYWKQENEQLCNRFIQDFKIKYNTLAIKNNYQEMP
jgi:AAA15 family ATPase/GTPase